MTWQATVWLLSNVLVPTVSLSSCRSTSVCTFTQRTNHHHPQQKHRQKTAITITTGCYHPRPISAAEAESINHALRHSFCRGFWKHDNSPGQNWREATALGGPALGHKPRLHQPSAQSSAHASPSFASFASMRRTPFISFGISQDLCRLTLAKIHPSSSLRNIA